MEKNSKRTGKDQAVKKKVIPKNLKKTPPGDLIDIDELATGKEMPGWEKAAFFRSAGWASGKKITKKEFDQTWARFKKRQMGSGRI